jgi:signal transduction histidine kinase
MATTRAEPGSRRFGASELPTGEEADLPIAPLLEAQKEIIDTMARGTGLRETLSQITSLVERLAPPALCSILLLDKSRVLQILVNLIGNTKQAIVSAPGQSHHMTPQVDITNHADGRRLRIRVEDDGEGIPKENLTQLFVHGFTARKNGHGFGLHSCALAAKDMGGTITAHSDGPGKGAAFTLLLPFKPVAYMR